MTRVTTYVGMCVGGPKNGQRIETYQPTYQLARMRNVSTKQDDLGWQEYDRGHYEFDHGHWWWKGWALKR
jgi:hypothetical protein